MSKYISTLNMMTVAEAMESLEKNSEVYSKLNIYVENGVIYIQYED